MELSHPNQIPLLDAQAVTEAKSLMQDKYATLLAYFFEDSALYIDQIEKAYASANAEALVPPAHTLKSSSAQMGALRLSNAAAQIERTARDAIQSGQGLYDLAPVVTELKTILADTIAAS